MEQSRSDDENDDVRTEDEAWAAEEALTAPGAHDRQGRSEHRSAPMSTEDAEFWSTQVQDICRALYRHSHRMATELTAMTFKITAILDELAKIAREQRAIREAQQGMWDIASRVKQAMRDKGLL